MKEGNQKSHAINKKNYLYIALGLAALLLALVVIITSVALANRGNSELKRPADIIIPGDGTQDGGGEKLPDDGNNKPVDGNADEFLAPVENVSALHGYGFYHNQTLNNYYVHTGIDYAGEEGTNVLAAQDGTIEELSSSDVLVGGRIVINHGNGVKTVYEFVEASENLKVGDKVERGDVIGVIAAATGNEYKDGAHLHFEIQENGNPVDPTKYYTAEEK